MAGVALVGAWVTTRLRVDSARDGEVVPRGTVGVMAGLNVRFTDEELDALRERAERRAAACSRFAHDAVITAINEHSRLFNEAADACAEGRAPS